MKTKDTLNRITVLLLNRNWQPIHAKTPADAFCMMAAGAASGLDLHGEDHVVAVKWEDWVKLPVHENDRSVNTPRGSVRVPTVIVATNYARIPYYQPRFSSGGIWERDGGVCQYTGRALRPGEGNIDHVIPRSRGGPSSWENCVLAHREVNSKKADRLPHEAGLQLLRKPTVPRRRPLSAMIRNIHGIIDWQRFLVG